MNFFNCFKKNESSADKAKERLQILIASRKRADKHTFLPELEKKILELIQEYVQIGPEDVFVKVEEDEGSGLEVFELNVNLPDGNKLDLSSKK